MKMTPPNKFRNNKTITSLFRRSLLRLFFLKNDQQYVYPKLGRSAISLLQRHFLLFTFLFNATLIKAQNDLFFSEYYEGSTGCCNKCLELYNPSNTPIDLSLYTIAFYNNGNTNPGNSTFSIASRLNFTLLPPAQTVVLCQGAADVSLLSISDGTFGFGNYNGDDAIILRKNGSIIDAIGVIGCDPGEAWVAGGNSTKDNTLIRDPCIQKGNPGGDCSFPSLATEWGSIGADNASNLGIHNAGSMPVEIFGNNALCENTSIDLSATPDFRSYRWSTGSRSISITVSNPGTYSVTATSNSGCESVAEKHINQGTVIPIIASINSSTPVSCKPKKDGILSLNVSGGDGGYNYEWATGSGNSPEITNLGVGTYIITVSDRNGCSTTVTGQIEGEAAFSLNSIISNETCKGSRDGSIQLSTAGGQGNLMFSIDGQNFQNNGNFIDLAPATYPIIVVDNTGCGDDGQVTVEAGSRFDLRNSIITQSKCLREGGGQIILRPSGGLPPYQVSVDGAPFQSNMVISDLAGGTYELTVRDASGCEKTFPQIIEEGSDLEAIFTKEDATCKGLADGRIIFSKTGGVGSIYHLIDDDRRPYFNINEFNNLSIGKHTVTIGDGLFCEIEHEFIIEEKSKLEVLIEQTPICAEGELGDLIINPQNGIAPYEYKVDTNAFMSTNVFQDLAPKNYQILTKDSQGCEVLDTFHLRETLLEIITTETKSASCSGFKDAQISIITNLQEGIHYRIDGENYQTENVFLALAPDTYNVYVQTENCIDSQVVMILPTDELNIAANIVAIKGCAGAANGQIEIIANGGNAPYEYRINDGAFQRNNQFEQLSAGIYKLTIRDTNHCEAMMEETLTELSSFEATCSIIQHITATGQADGIANVHIMGGIPPYKLQFINQSDTILTSENEIIIENLAATNYVFEVLDASGCLSYCTFIIEEPICKLSLSSENSNITCFEGKDGQIDLIIQNANGLPNITWSDPSFNGQTMLNNLSIGVYHATVVDELNCIDSLSIKIVHPPTALNVEIIASDSIICHQGSSVLRVGRTYSEYNWSNGANTPTISIQEAGLYRLNVKDTSGCTATDSIFVEVLSTDTIYEEQYTCDISQIGTFITEERIGGQCNAVLIKSIELARIDSIFLFEETCDLSQEGISIIHLTNSFGCDSIIMRTIRLNPVNTTEVTNYTCDTAEIGTQIDTLLNQYLCDSLIISTTILADSHFEQLYQVTCNPQDTGVFRANFINQFGCDSILETQIVLAPIAECSFSFVVNTDTICPTEEEGNISIQALQGNPPFTYFIMSPNRTDTFEQGSILDNRLSTNIKNLTVGTYLIELINEQEIQKSVVVELSPIAAIEVSSTISDYNGYAISCEGASDGHIVLSSVANYDFLWNTGSKSPSLQNLQADIYEVTITDKYNCSISNTYELQAAPLPIVDYEINAPSCFGDSLGQLIIFDTSEEIQYSFDNHSYSYIPSMPFTIADLNMGQVQLFFKNKNECQVTEVINIPAAQALELDLGKDLTLSLGDEYRIIPNANFDIAHYEWESEQILDCNNCAEITLQAVNSTAYHLTAYDENDCSIADSINVTVSTNKLMYLPNVFSPNEDGINDTYMIYPSKAVEQINILQIVDAEGRLVHQIQNQAIHNIEAWDGSFNGQAMQPATFIVFVEAALINGTIKTFVQTVNLMK